MVDPTGNPEGGGTIVCGIDASGGHGAVQLAKALSERLGLRLVLVHVAGRIGPPGPANAESRGTARRRDEAARLLARVAGEHELDGRVALRASVGDRAASMARIAAEEGADLIVVGSRRRGFLLRGLRCTLACELESVTDCPVVVAPPPTRRRSGRRLAVAGGGPER